MATWQLQDAKARLSELIEAAKEEGPQVITQRGVKSAVVLQFSDWERAQQPKGHTLLEILRSGPTGELAVPSRKGWKMRRPVEL